MSAFQSGPIPPYTNPPIEPQFYKPKRFVISDITLGQTTIVTTLLDTDYVIGQLVRLVIPSSFGCVQLNMREGFKIPTPNSFQDLTSYPNTDGTDSYLTDLLTTIRVSFPECFVIPGAVSVYIDLGGANETFYQDNGQGLMDRKYGPYTISSGVINYTTGIIAFVFSVIPILGQSVSASFFYNQGNIPNRTFIDIDSSQNVNPFFADSISPTLPEILAIGDINNGVLNAYGNLNTGLTIPGSFTNISPL